MAPHRPLAGALASAALGTLAAASTLPGVASALSVVSATRDYSIEIQLGGGVFMGDRCVGNVPPAGECRRQIAASGALDPSLPLVDGSFPSVGSGGAPEDNQVEGRGLHHLFAADDVDLSLPGVFGVGDALGLVAQDSPPAAFHTSVDSHARANSAVVLDTSLSLLPEQTLRMRASLFVVDDGMSSLFSGSYEVLDLDTGQSLASFTLASPGTLDLDITDLVGHRLQASFEGEIALSLPAGFADGAGTSYPLGRTFRHMVGGGLELTVVPEPASAFLLGLGLAALAALRGSARARPSPAYSSRRNSATIG